jgi:hypothetical protein
VRLEQAAGDRAVLRHRRQLGGLAKLAIGIPFLPGTTPYRWACHPGISRSSASLLARRRRSCAFRSSSVTSWNVKQPAAPWPKWRSVPGGRSLNSGPRVRTSRTRPWKLALSARMFRRAFVCTGLGGRARTLSMVVSRILSLASEPSSISRPATDGSLTEWCATSISSRCASLHIVSSAVGREALCVAGFVEPPQLASTKLAMTTTAPL